MFHHYLNSLQSFCRMAQLLFLVFTSLSKTVSGTDLLSSDCLSDFNEVQTLYLGYCMDSERKEQRFFYNGRACLEDSEIIVIKDFTLYIPGELYRECDGQPTPFKYKKQVKASCLQQVSHETRGVKQFLLPFLETYNGKRQDELDENSTSIIYSKIGDGEKYGLEEGSVLDLEHDCETGEEGETKTMFYMDMCINKTGPEIKVLNQARIRFNADTYKRSAPMPSCFCKVSSWNTTTDNIRISARDVQLQGSVELKISSGGRERTLDSSEVLYWWQDGILFQSSQAVVVEIANLKLEELPDSIWLDVKGQNLTIICGSKPFFLEKPVAEAATPYGLIIGIIVGVLLLVVVIIFIWRCCKRRRKDAEDKADLELDSVPSSPQSREGPRPGRERPPSHEAVYATPGKGPQLEETGKLLPQPQEYFELEHQYEETKDPSNNNYKPGASRDTDQEQQYESTEGSWSKNMPQGHQDAPENVYNHLRERPDVVPSENLYDTTVSSNYARLDRNASPPPVIDNIYNKCD